MKITLFRLNESVGKQSRNIHCISQHLSSIAQNHGLLKMMFPLPTLQQKEPAPELGGNGETKIHVMLFTPGRT